MRPGVSSRDSQEHVPCQRGVSVRAPRLRIRCLRSGRITLGCLLRFLGFFFLFLVLAVAVRRLTEREAVIPPPAAGEKDTLVRGIRWRSREVGGDIAPPVIFVHGLLSSSKTWKKVLASSASGHTAIAVDLPGEGFSDRPWPYDYSAPSQALALLDFLDARKIDRAVLVGNSLGAGVSLIAAAARPERVAGLVLVDAAFPGMTIPWSFRTLRTPALGELQIEFLVRPVVEFGLRHRLYARAGNVTEETVSDWWDPIPVPGTRRAALGFVRSRTAGYEGLLPKIRVPTLIVWGKEDRLLPDSDGMRLASEMPGARLVILPDCGHLPQEEAPTAFSSIVAEFVKNLPAAERAVPRPD
jgi:pimeloyl-ACP methyl ester carboxylesterase